MDVIGSLWGRIAACTAVTAAGAYASFTGDPVTAASLAGALTTLLGGVAANVLSNDVHGMWARKRLDAGELLRNHDLTALVGRVLRLRLEDLAQDDALRSDREALRAMAGAAEAVWAQASGFARPGLKPLSEPELHKLLAARGESDPGPAVLAPEDWLAVLKYIMVTADVWVSREGLHHVAQRLDASFRKGLFELLKEDAVSGGKAYPAMQLMLATQIIESIRDVQAELTQLGHKSDEQAAAIRDLTGVTLGMKDRIAAAIEELDDRQDDRMRQLHARMNDQFAAVHRGLDAIHDTLRRHVEETPRVARPPTLKMLPAAQLAFPSDPAGTLHARFARDADDMATLHDLYLRVLAGVTQVRADQIRRAHRRWHALHPESMLLIEVGVRHGRPEPVGFSVMLRLTPKAYARYRTGDTSMVWDWDSENLCAPAETGTPLIYSQTAHCLECDHAHAAAFFTQAYLEQVLAFTPCPREAPPMVIGPRNTEAGRDSARALGFERIGRSDAGYHLFELDLSGRVGESTPAAAATRDALIRLADAAAESRVVTR